MLGIVFDVVAPVFGALCLGWAATFTPVFDQSAQRALFSFTYYFAIPVLLFHAMATGEPVGAALIDLLIAYWAALAAIFLAGMAAARFLLGGHGLDRQAILAIAATYGNNVLLGIPLGLTAFGPEARIPLFAIVSTHAVILFPLVTALASVGRDGADALHRLPLIAARSIWTNPLVAALVLGQLWAVFAPPLPTALDRFGALFGQAAAPCALFAAGAALRDYGLRGAAPETATIWALKALLHPALCALAMQFVEAPPIWEATAILLAAMPTGVNAYLFSVRYRTYEGPVANAVLATTLTSVLTVTVILSIL